MDEYDTIAMTGTYPSTSSFVKVQILSEWHMALCESNEIFLDTKKICATKGRHGPFRWPIK